VFVAVTAVACAVVGLVALVMGIRSHLPTLRRIARESLPFLLAAGTLSTLAGVTIQSRLGPLVSEPALLIVIPPLLSLSGSLAGVLSARVSTKLHLGVVRPDRFSFRSVSEDVVLVYVIAVPIFIVLGIGADLLALLVGLGSPGLLEMLELMLLAGVLATVLSCVIAYFGALLTYRLGWDPDNNGIPIVSSASDFLGAAAFMVSLAILGLS
jgi:mgtE-like transporter